MTLKKFVDVAITSDLVCPWCWVGLRHLQEASKLANVEPRITWHPFILRPDFPTEGKPKEGSPASRVGSHLKSAGQAAGIEFTGLTDRTPNTTLFHATMKYLQEDMRVDPTVATEFHQAVFEAYFTLGIFPDEDGILNAARNEKVRGESRTEELRAAIKELYSDKKKLARLKEEVYQEALDARRNGVNGVPSFAFGDSKHNIAFSGAHPVSTFVRYLKKHAYE